MADDSILRQAWDLYKRGMFSIAIETLEAKIFLFRDDPEYYRILGLSCLQLGDWKGGETYLERSRQLDPSVHRDTLLGLMAVRAMVKDLSASVKHGLDLLDRDPEDKTAKKALAMLRQVLAAGDSSATMGPDMVRPWLPAYRRTNPALQKWGLRILLSFGIIVCIVGGAWWGLTLVGPQPLKTSARAGAPTEQLPSEATDTVLPGDGFSLKLSPEEVKLGWERVQAAFKNYQDSRARYEINRLLLSNASATIKQRARDLIAYLHEPDFSRPDDTSSYLEVRTAPTLYEGCTVRWSGALSNLNLGTTKISFDLLVGYEKGQVVEGIVPVELTFAALLKNSQTVEVLGRIALRDGKWFLQGTSLRDLGYRAP